MKYSVLKKLLSQVNGAAIISIDTLTVERLRGGRSNPFYGKVKKRVTGSNVMVFQNKTTNAYENMVQRRLIDEGKDPTLFELSPRPWGVRLQDTPFVKHGSEYYLEVIFLRSGKVKYYVSGRLFQKDDILDLEARGEEPEQGGLVNKVIVRSYKCESVIAITINGKRYK